MVKRRNRRRTLKRRRKKKKSLKMTLPDHGLFTRPVLCSWGALLPRFPRPRLLLWVGHRRQNWIMCLVYVHLFTLNICIFQLCRRYPGFLRVCLSDPHPERRLVHPKNVCQINWVPYCVKGEMTIWQFLYHTQLPLQVFQTLLGNVWS